MSKKKIELFIDEDRLDEQIKRLKLAYDLGIDSKLFEKLVSHMSDELTVHNIKHEKTLEEWFEFYNNRKPQKAEVSLEQLEELFNYLTRFYASKVTRNKSKYLFFKEDFQPVYEQYPLEYLSLKSFEVAT